jgi:YidC/Oxa1 family membrane protein insertase
VSEPQKNKGLRPELRILVASLLSMAVIVAWAKFFAPKAPTPTPQTNKPAASAPAVAGQPPSSTTPNVTAPGGTPAATSVAPSAVASAAVKSDSQERTVVVENNLYRVEFSNRGGVVKSWQLKKYKDDAKPPRVLDVVHPEASQELNGWPLSVSLSDPNLDQTAAGGLFQVTSQGGASAPATVSAPAELNFTWSDGHLEVIKRFKFDHSYVVQTEVTAKLDGKPVTAGLTWLGGFGDNTVQNPVAVETTSTFYSEGGKLNDFVHKKLEDGGKWGPAVWQGGKDWAGIEDRYFAAVFLSPVGAAPGAIETRYWKTWHTIKVDNSGKQEDKAEPVPQVAVAASAQPGVMRLYVGPKDYDDLKHMNPPLQSLVNFGWLEIVADPLFHALKWIHNYVPNWGWAIVLLTLVINMLLFPLRISSYKTTMKMQRVGPEVKAIQEKYKKYKLNDPRKAEMNQEVMAVYSREGINPLGGCLQMLPQMPIWFGLNRTLSSAIEMRHAPWFGWITDLSSKDPFYILPVVMAGSMYLVSKMTPVTTTDPQQQMMMKFMPLSFAAMFIVFPISSGLAVYILTSSLVGIAQQWYLNKTHPVTAVVPAKNGRGKKS